eukprot:s3627_g9.t1
MLRLERMNPVGPRAAVPLISDARLRQDIEAGKPIWQARREHRARERAAKYRQATTERTTLNTSQPSRLTEVSPSEGGEVLDEAFAASAKANLAEFKRVLREEARGEKKGKPRQADSDRRKKIKKDRRKEKKPNTKDDAERDRNHAIAHGKGGSVASFSPGLQGMVLAATVGMSQGMKSEGIDPAGKEEYPFDMASGAFFDLGVAMLMLGMLWLCLSASRLLKENVLSWWKDPSSPRGFASPARRVGGTRKKVRFSIPRKGKATQPPPETPFLGGPRAASRKHPPGKPFRLATIQGRQEGLSLLLSRYAQSTATNYQSQWGWWALFCRRLRRRFGTKERRMPVTPEMLKWLGEHLQYGRSQEASLLWGALTLGFFFLLRASEYLDVGYQDPNRGLRGCDITLKLNGKAFSLERLSEADEVTILVRGSKTDIYNRGQVRNHFRTSERVCVVKAMAPSKLLGVGGSPAVCRMTLSLCWLEFAALTRVESSKNITVSSRPSMPRADSDTDTAASEQEGKVSDAQMVVYGNDEQIRAAGSRVSEDLCQIDLTSTLQKADKMFSSMMDPNNEDTKKLVESLFHEPMKQITQTALEAIQRIDLRDAEEAKVQMETVSSFLKIQAEIRETALDNVYEAMQRQVDHFSMSVDTYNQKMKETVEQALELYQKRINTEIVVRQQVLTQKKAEHKAMLEAYAEETKVKAGAMDTMSKAQTEASARKLQQQKAKDERQHDKEVKALERLNLKMNQELQHAKQKDLNEAEKAMRDLEAKARRGKIEQDERAAINNELKIEMDRYNQEFELAKTMMANALSKGRSCRIEHTAPKIDWGPPARVVPGYIKCHCS